MRKIYSIILLIPFWQGSLLAQELYIFTDPASNIPANAFSFRLNTMLMPMADMDINLPYPDMADPYKNSVSTRVTADITYGLSKNLMVKMAGYGSNMMQDAFRFEGISLYTKYRFLSNDDFHSHFRMAGFGKIALNGNPYQMSKSTIHSQPDGNGGVIMHNALIQHSSDEQNLEGNHSGAQVGIVATQLIHKLALSGSASFLQRMKNGKNDILQGDEKSAFQYSFSAGYLLFPKDYESYGQTNVNLYTEIIGQQGLNKGTGFIDLGPGVQFIFNSKIRLDAAYRFQVSGQMKRFNKGFGLLRLEYNWLR